MPCRWKSSSERWLKKSYQNCRSARLLRGSLPSNRWLKVLARTWQNHRRTIWWPIGLVKASATGWRLWTSSRVWPVKGRWAQSALTWGPWAAIKLYRTARFKWHMKTLTRYKFFQTGVKKAWCPRVPLIETRSWLFGRKRLMTPHSTVWRKEWASILLIRVKRSSTTRTSLTQMILASWRWTRSRHRIIARFKIENMNKFWS